MGDQRRHEPLVTREGLPQGADDSDSHVVARAAVLFLERGVASVKVTDIAVESGVGVATIYRHFSTKAGIAIAAASLLWDRLNAQLEALVESEAFLAMNGAERLEALLSHYCSAYLYHKGFVAFLDELDHLVLTEGADPAALASYGEKVDSFYLIFEDAYLMGRQDGSVVRAVDFPVFYRTVAHALMSVACKFAHGEVIPSDDFSATGGAAELACIVDMAVTALTAHGAKTGARAHGEAGE